MKRPKKLIDVMRDIDPGYDRPIFEKTDLTDPNYTILVLNYAFGQYRIQITDKRLIDPFAPAGHGSIEREM